MSFEKGGYIKHMFASNGWHNDLATESHLEELAILNWFKKTVRFSSFNFLLLIKDMLKITNIIIIFVILNNQKLESTSTLSDAKPVFVSLGSYCTPALMIKNSEYSIGSFPIDWVLSIDGEGLIVMLQENFANFLNLDYLQCDIAGYLINNYYRITFSHEGSWHQNKDWKEKFPEFFERMERRINRFKNLNNLKQKVYFIRKAWPLSTHPNYNFTNKENLKISDDYAIRLYESLKVPLPDLDYRLIILNPAENKQYEIRNVTDKIIVCTYEYGIKELVEMIRDIFPE